MIPPTTPENHTLEDLIAEVEDEDPQLIHDENPMDATEKAVFQQPISDKLIHSMISTITF